MKIISILFCLFFLKLYSQFHETNTGLFNDVVYSIDQDDEAQIWFTTYSGIYVYNGETNEKIEFDTQDEYGIWGIEKDSYNRKWLMQYRKNPRYIKDKVVFEIKQNYASQMVYNCEVNDTIFFTDFLFPNKAMYLDEEKMELKEYVHRNDGKLLASPSEFHFKCDEGVFKYGIGGAHKRQVGKNWVDHFFLNSEGELVKGKTVSIRDYNGYRGFLNFKNGLFNCTINDKSLRVICDILNNNLENADKIVHVLIDHERNLWITYSHDRFRCIQKKNYFNKRPTLNKLTSNIRKTAGSNSCLYILSFDSKVYKYNLITDKIELLFYNRDFKIENLFVYKNFLYLSLSDNRRYIILNDKGGFSINKGTGYVVDDESEGRWLPPKFVIKDRDVHFLGTSFIKNDSIFISKEIEKIKHTICGGFNINSKNYLYSKYEVYLQGSHSSEDKLLYKSTERLIKVIPIEDRILLVKRNGEIEIRDSLCRNLLDQYFCEVNAKSAFLNENDLFIGTNIGIINLFIDSTLNWKRNYTKFGGLKNQIINDVFYLDGSIVVSSKDGVTILEESEYDIQYPDQRLSIENIIGYDSNNNSIEVSEKIFPSNVNSIVCEIGFIDLTSEKNYKTYYSINHDNLVLVNGTAINFNSLKPGDYKVDIYRIGNKMNNKVFHKQIKFSLLAPFYQTPLFLLLSLIGFAFVFYYIINYFHNIALDRANFSTEVLRLNQKVLRSQLNPHFIFNSLQSVQLLIFENRGKEANKHLVNFSRLLRASLDNSRSDLVTLEEEIDFIGKYLNLESARLKEKFSFEISVSTSAKEIKDKIPSMLFQPIIENSIIHGFGDSRSSIHLKIDFFLDEKMNLKCVFKDNGVGLGNSKISDDRKSWSQAITLERLNLYYKGNARLSTETIYSVNNEPQGVKTTLIIPL